MFDTGFIRKLFTEETFTAPRSANDINFIPYPPYRTRKKEYKITQLSEYWKDTTIYNTQMVLPNG